MPQSVHSFFNQLAQAVGKPSSAKGGASRAAEDGDAPKPFENLLNQALRQKPDAGKIASTKQPAKQANSKPAATEPASKDGNTAAASQDEAGSSSDLSKIEEAEAPKTQAETQAAALPTPLLSAGSQAGAGSILSASASATETSDKSLEITENAAIEDAATTATGLNSKFADGNSPSGTSATQALPQETALKMALQRIQAHSAPSESHGMPLANAIGASGHGPNGKDPLEMHSNGAAEPESLSASSATNAAIGAGITDNTALLAFALQGGFPGSNANTPLAASIPMSSDASASQAIDTRLASAAPNGATLAASGATAVTSPAFPAQNEFPALQKAETAPIADAMSGNPSSLSDLNAMAGPQQASGDSAIPAEHPETLPLPAFSAEGSSSHETTIGLQTPTSPATMTPEATSSPPVRGLEQGATHPIEKPGVSMDMAMNTSTPGEIASAMANRELTDTKTTATTPLNGSVNPSSAEQLPSELSSAIAALNVGNTGLNQAGDASPTKGIQQAIQNIQNTLTALNGHVESHAGASNSNADAKNREDFEASFSQAANDALSLESAIGLPQTDATPGQTTLSTHDAASSLQSAGVAPMNHASASANAAGPTQIPAFASQAQTPMEQVLDGTVYSVKNGHRELIIRLNPDNLGEVRINLVSNGQNSLTARLIASTPESRDLLQGQLHSLQSSLEAQGIQVERMSVILAGQPDSLKDFKHHSQNQQSQQEQAFQQPGQQQNASQNHSQHRQPEQNPFSQMAGQAFQHPQHRAGYAQNPSSNRATGLEQAGGTGTESGLDADNRTSQRNQPHSNGQVSILA